MRTGAAERLARLPLNGYWYRAVRLKHWRSRLATDHTRHSASRYSPADLASTGYRILYLGETHQVVLYEVGALLGQSHSPIPDPKGSWIVLSLHVVLDQVADLCLPAQQKLLKTNDQELTGTWTSTGGDAPTQKLGVALEKVPGMEGFVFPSAKPPGRNLGVFPDKLGPRSAILFHNELDGRYEKLT